MLRSLDPKKDFQAPKKKSDMSPGELHYVDLVVHKQIPKTAQPDNRK